MLKLVPFQICSWLSASNWPAQNGQFNPRHPGLVRLGGLWVWVGCCRNSSRRLLSTPSLPYSAPTQSIRTQTRPRTKDTASLTHSSQPGPCSINHGWNVQSPEAERPTKLPPHRILQNYLGLGRVNRVRSGIPSSSSNAFTFFFDSTRSYTLRQSMILKAFLISWNDPSTNPPAFSI